MNFDVYINKNCILEINHLKINIVMINCMHKKTDGE